MKIKLLLVFLVLLPLFALSAHGEEYGADSLDGFGDIIPDSVDPGGEDAEEIADDFTIGHVVDLIAAELGEIAEPVTRQLAILLGTVVLISAVTALKSSMSNTGLTAALEYATLLCGALAAYNAVAEVWERLSDALGNLTAFMTGLIPMMTALYAAGGQRHYCGGQRRGTFDYDRPLGAAFILRAVAGAARLLRAGSDYRTGRTDQPDGRVAGDAQYVHLRADVYHDDFNRGVLGFQTNLALSADNLSARALKFAASSYIPVVGGALGDAVRAIGGSVGLLRATLGTASVAVIFALVLPSVLQIYLCRLTFSLVGTAAKLVGCDREGAFFEEMRSMLGFGLSLLVSCTVMFLFFVTLFSRAAVGITQ